MSGSIPTGRVANLVGAVPSPAFSGLATRLASVIADGLLPLDQRLPSERDLATALGLSRTTVTRAYGMLREAGYAAARQGSGTWTRVPGGPARGHDRALLPQPDRASTMDLSCAAPAAVPGLASAYASAAAALPAYLTGHGYFPLGLPELREAIAERYRRRGLPTTSEQVLVTSGAIAAIAAAAQALLGPGDRVLVESPVYPNAVTSLRRAGARVVPVPVDPDGWDLDAMEATLRQAAPRAAYLIPDYQNPTGLLMDDAQRHRLGAALARSRAVAIVDESHADLHLEQLPIPAPMAAHSPSAITIGGSSKAFWGGLRVGWLRVPHGEQRRFTRARLGLDLGAPILEQLVLTELLTGPDSDAHQQRERLRAQRDVLAGALTDRLPDWRFRIPAGGLSLWCELPRPVAAALAVECERRGLVITPGSVFAPEGGLASFVRLPYTRPEADLLTAVDVLHAAWTALDGRHDVADPVRILIA